MTNNKSLKERLIFDEGQHQAPELFIANNLPRGYPVTHYAVAFFYRFGSSDAEFLEKDVNIDPGDGLPVYGERKDCCKEIRVIIVVTTPSGRKLESAGQFFPDNENECIVRQSISVDAEDSIHNLTGDIQVKLVFRD